MCGTRLRRGGLWLLLLLLAYSPLFSDEVNPSEMTTDAIISELLANLDERELVLNEKEQLLRSVDESLSKRASFLETISNSLNERERYVNENLNSLTEIENSLTSYADAVRREIWTRNIVILVVTAVAVWGWIN